jgi:glycosyltransferase involved in cell wall biosynthesis
MSTERHRLVIAGRGPMLDTVRGWVADRGIEDRVCFLGYVGQGDLPALLQASDALVLPSVATVRWREPWGLVVNEAMNAGLAVIATDSVGATAGGLLVHDETGLVVRQRDARALAGAIDVLAGDSETRRRLATAANAHVLDWNYEVQADGFERALNAARVKTRSSWDARSSATRVPS